MCNGRWNKFVSMMMLCMGAVSFLFGLLMFLIVKPDGHAANTLMGMFTGFGAGILGVAVTRLIRQKVVSKEKLEQEEIERQDERNIAIMRAAGLVGFYTAIGLFAVLVCKSPRTAAAAIPSVGEFSRGDVFAFFDH